MNSTDLFSSSSDLVKIKNILIALLRLPLTEYTISGNLMERVFAHVRNAKVLQTYDFVDVIDEHKKIGWQVKSTMSTTPVTWIRGKISNRENMISESEKSKEGLSALGKAIIDYCNLHVWNSGFLKYDLEHIGYVRLIVFPDGNITYFEKYLCSKGNPELFNPNDYVWAWSKQKEVTKKEHLPALHGYIITSGEKRKHWAWHGRGENQLHFSSEETWWPDEGTNHRVDLRFPEQGKLSFDDLVKMLL